MKSALNVFQHEVARAHLRRTAPIGEEAASTVDGTPSCVILQPVMSRVRWYHGGVETFIL